MPAKAAIFIDGSNFFKYCEDLRIYSYQLEWDKLLQDIVMARQIVYARYYDCPKHEQEVPEQAKRQKQFFSLLRQIPWMTIVFGRLEPRFDSAGKRYLIEKAVDVNIAVDMILGAVRDEYDHAFLLLCSSDWTPTGLRHSSEDTAVRDLQHRAVRQHRLVRFPTVSASVAIPSPVAKPAAWGHINSR